MDLQTVQTKLDYISSLVEELPNYPEKTRIFELGKQFGQLEEQQRIIREKRDQIKEKYGW